MLIFVYEEYVFVTEVMQKVIFNQNFTQTSSNSSHFIQTSFVLAHS